MLHRNFIAITPIILGGMVTFSVRIFSLEALNKTCAVGEHFFSEVVWNERLTINHYPEIGWKIVHGDFTRQIRPMEAERAIRAHIAR